ncbi:MAG: Tetratricopeptide repeat family protein, partial [Parcubacteria group bacterium GW2011_GWC1_36_9]
PQIAFFYLKTFFWPASLAIDRQEIIREVSFYNFYLPLIFVLLFLSVTGTALFLIYKRNGNNFKICLFFLLWFGLGMGLHLQIFPLDMALAERWFYFPIAGLLGLVLISGSQFNLFNQKKLLYFFVILIIFALSIRTFIRTFDWRNGLTLFSHDIKLSGKSFSTKLAPYWWTNWNNLGVIYERQKDFERAGKSYQKAIDNGKYYLAYENLAGLFLNHKKSPKEAKEFIEKSLIDLPNNWKLHYILALSELQLENREPAIQSARKAYQLSPNEQTYRLLKNMATNSP